MGKEITKVGGVSQELEIADERRKAIRDISDQFGVAKTVSQLQKMMEEVTKEEISPNTVNAACNCVQNLNLTIKTAMQAARFLSGK
jgi:UTP:GlnB (protein PII) uridylyltransferase